jgi:dihydrofolate synthase/folylpolyglutamate synthase
MKYSQTLDFLYSSLPMFHRIGAAAYKANLDNTLAISDILGNPEKKYRTIHIAGTNGKGSTSHFLASILQEAGYRTGLFTSPHLKDFRERIKVNGNMIGKREVTSFVQNHRSVLEHIRPSFFEWTFGLATSWFAKQEVDVAVIETGMGGRLDSTNIILPELSVITNIGFDHLQFLGDTLLKIAAEKAGIIKPGVPVIIGETQAETYEYFIEKAGYLNSPVFFADHDYYVSSWEVNPLPAPLIQLIVSSRKSPFSIEVSSPLTGEYQLKNILTVIRSVDALRLRGFSIHHEQLQKGIRNVLRNTNLNGRWQILGYNPMIIADIGHNIDGIRAVTSQLAGIQCNQLHFVLGMVNDKDVQNILEILPPQARYYFCKADIPRGLDAEELGAAARQAGLAGNCYLSVKEAFTAAKRNARQDDIIMIGGSTFVVAEAL